MIGLMAQPGVGFGNQNVASYVPEAARALSQSLNDFPGLVFEAHSTDRQTPAKLREGLVAPKARDLARAAVSRMLRIYSAACQSG